MHLITLRRVVVAVALLATGTAGFAQKLSLTPFKASGIYDTGERAGWTVALPDGVAAPANGYTYKLLENHFKPIKSGVLDLTKGPVTITAVMKEPTTLFLEIVPATGGTDRTIAGAVIAPTKLQPSVKCPADFDAFWQSKLQLLAAVPVNPVITPGDSGRDGVRYETVKLDNIGGAHVYGQIAHPARDGKFPAVLILQWAGGPYPLQKAWVNDRAAEGWLALNVEAHDVPGDMPAEFYAALPQMIKNYTTIYNDDRDRNYFLRMYLGDYRALEYLTSRPEWDGRTLLVMGTSMGGQQSLCVAGLYPKITHVIVDVPAGADADAALHGRMAGYPNWDSTNPKVMKTGLYFDTVNFAPHIKARCLVAMGFVDETCPPVGVWTAFNQIAGPKEAIPLVDSPHNHLATPEQQKPYFTRSGEWLAALVKGEEPPPEKITSPHD